MPRNAASWIFTVRRITRSPPAEQPVERRAPAGRTGRSGSDGVPVLAAFLAVPVTIGPTCSGSTKIST